MELIILRTNLIEGLSLAERAVGENTNLPILKNVLIKSSGNKINLVSTNLELAVECSVPGKIIQGGEATVPFSILSSVVRNLNAERIVLTEKNKKLVVGAENYEATIQVQDPKEFPIIPSIGAKSGSVKIKTGVLKGALAGVVVAAQFSDIRPEISGIYFNYSDGFLTLAATDGFRLSEVKVDSKETKSDLDGASMIVPLRTATELMRILGTDEDLEILIDPNQVLFRSANKKVISRLIDGTFPDYKAVIPGQFQNEASVDRNELVNALKLASSFSGRANDVILRTGDNKKFLEVYSSDSSLGENCYKIPVKLKGEKFSLVFNWRYLLDGLKIYDSKEIVLGVNAADRPVVIKSREDQRRIYVAMPIRN